MIKARKLPSIIVFNDAKSCYDRVVLLVISLSLRRLGISEQINLEEVETLWGTVRSIWNLGGYSDILPIIMRTKWFGLYLVLSLSFHVLLIAELKFVDGIDLIYRAKSSFSNSETVLKAGLRSGNSMRRNSKGNRGQQRIRWHQRSFWYFLNFTTQGNK